MKSYCGVNCNECKMNNECNGCISSNGCPFGGKCLAAEVIKISKSQKELEEYKKNLMKEFNSLKVKGMPKVTKLYELKGSFINLKYKLQNDKEISFWNNNDIYLGTQLEKEDSNKCFGLVASANYLMISEYEENGDNPKIVIFKER